MEKCIPNCIAFIIAISSLFISCSSQQSNQYYDVNKGMYSHLNNNYKNLKDALYNLKGDIKSINISEEGTYKKELKYTFNRKKEIIEVIQKNQISNSKREYLDFRKGHVSSISYLKDDVFTVKEEFQYTDGILTKRIYYSEPSKKIERDFRKEECGVDTICMIDINEFTYKYVSNNLVERIDNRGQISESIAYKENEIVRSMRSGELVQVFDYSGNLLAETSKPRRKLIQSNFTFNDSQIQKIETSHYNVDRDQKELSRKIKVDFNYSALAFNKRVSIKYTFTDHYLGVASTKEEKYFILYNDKYDVIEENRPFANSEMWALVRNGIGEVRHLKYSNYMYDSNSNWISREVYLLDDKSESEKLFKVQTREIIYYD